MSETPSESSETPPEFAGQVAVVTGGSRGIGAGIAAALAACGARVVVTGRDQRALGQVIETIREAGGIAEAVPADLTVQHEIEALRQEVERIYGPASLLAACAGGGGEPKPLVEETPERWRATLEANLTSAFLTLRAFLPAMMHAGRGAVVTLSSSAGRQLSGAS